MSDSVVKFFFRVLLGFIVLCLLWHIGLRLISHRNPIEIYQLSAPTFSGYQIKVGTFNIAHGRGPELGAKNWEGGTLEVQRARLQAMGKLLKDNALDLVILNEADRSANWSGNLDEPRIIAEASGLGMVVFQDNYAAGTPFAIFRFGNALLSRLPVKRAQRVKCKPYVAFEDVLVGNHDLLWATLETAPGQLLHVIGAHFEVRDEDTRVSCAKKILELAGGLSEPLLLMGDFNSAPRTFPQYQQTTLGENALEVLLASKRFQILPVSPTLAEHFTFPSQKPDRIIDWILAPRIGNFKNIKF